MRLRVCINFPRLPIANALEYEPEFVSPRVNLAILSLLIGFGARQRHRAMTNQPRVGIRLTSLESPKSPELTPAVELMNRAKPFKEAPRWGYHVWSRDKQLVVQDNYSRYMVLPVLLPVFRGTRPLQLMNLELCQQMIKLRRNHPSWLLLASRNGPLILACLKSLTDAHPGGIAFEDAVEHLRGLFADNANDAAFEVGDDHAIAARRELRQWLKRGLIVEREGLVLATDALQRSFQFLDSLEDQPMTSTASRLATVQREIENLEAQLSRSQSEREESLKRRIAALEEELAAVQSGDFEVLSGSQAEEGIREVYQLAVSLRTDFRRVEDSYREADRALRQRIISEKQHRGEIVDELLDGHEALVKTVEGQVFESFHQQLVKSAELEQMKQRLRAILENENTNNALERKQKADLRSLVSRLVQESERVIQARARSERDVRGFLKSGLADEQIRVGAVLQDLFQVALEVDWKSQTVRRTPGPLPPVAVATPNLPLVERLLIKEVIDDDTEDLDLTVSEADPTQMDDEFWHAYRALDRSRLFESTIDHLRLIREPLTIGALAAALPPSHDLETLTYWLAMAREAGIEIDEAAEVIDLSDEREIWTRFYVPTAELTSAEVEKLDPGTLE